LRRGEWKKEMERRELQLKDSREENLKREVLA
jgi:hypothetical protein